MLNFTDITFNRATLLNVNFHIIYRSETNSLIQTNNMSS